jgi:stalled ribosome alternative rescue factor ArfA
MTAPRKTPIPDNALPALVISVLFWVFLGARKKHEILAK